MGAEKFNEMRETKTGFGAKMGGGYAAQGGLQPDDDSDEDEEIDDDDEDEGDDGIDQDEDDDEGSDHNF